MNENLFEALDRGSLLRSAYKYAQTDDDAEDYTQEALLNALERSSDINISELPGYLKKSIFCTHKTTLKEIKRHLAYIEIQQSRQQKHQDALYTLQLKAFSEKAGRLINQLSPAHRRTLKYRLLDYSVKKISKLMKVKEGTVLSRLHHVRKKLQDELSEYSDLI